MPHSKSNRRDSTHSSTYVGSTGNESSVDNPLGEKSKRIATVYDAVAGRVGLNGFLTPDQLASTNVSPSRPEEVLLRRVGAPDEIPYDFYNADERLQPDQRLPGSDVLKAIHAYASDYFATISTDRGYKDSRTFDGTALLALGVLLEEASKEALGENGDMALAEPEGLENVRPESKMTQYQIIGKVRQRKRQQREPQHNENDSDSDSGIIQSPKKRQRAEI